MIPLLALAAIAPAASPALRPIISGIAEGADGARVVALVVLNPGERDVRHAFAATLEASLIGPDGAVPVRLRRVEAPADDIVPAHGFAQARYAFTLPVGAAGGMATLNLAETSGGYAFAVARNVPAAQAAAAPAGMPPPPTMAFNPEPPAAKPDRGNAYLGNLSTYTPIYAVYGPGTDSDARIQIGFKYQLLGEAGEVGPGAPWANGIHFGYSQRIFWDLGKKSSPFRNVEYLPELFYLLPARPVGRGLQIGGQAGIRHESNGRAGLDSRSVNTIYVQPVATTTLGAYTLSVGPRAWAYVGSLEDNPRIKRYRGNTGLLAEIGEPDGWRLTTTTRINFGSGKGSFDAEASYPLDRLFDTSLNLYVFGQGFVGYGENLFDYDRRATRLRIGFGFVR